MKCYASRLPGQALSREHTRPFYVIDDLNSLRGPSKGVVTLPATIDWSTANRFDVSDPVRRRSMYSKVLAEAPGEDALSTYLNRALLAREWASLRLPGYIRAAWEQTHPELAQH